MATYTEKVFASDSYQDTGIGGSAAIRKPTISALAKYDFYNNTGVVPTWSPIEYSVIHIAFPLPSTYGKKRITSIEPYVYFVSKSAYGSGPLPAGDFIHQITRPYGSGFTRNQSYDHGSQYAVENLPTGRYMALPWFNGDFCIKSGVTANLYQKENYTSDAVVSIQSHLGTNKPYAIINFEDVIPYVSSPSPSNGFVNEKADNVFSWKFNYDNSNIWLPIYGGWTKPVASPLKQSSAKFRWKPYGQTNYTEIVIQGDFQSITIPANTFSTEKIQWQVVVTSDDGVESAPSEWVTLTTIDSNANAKAVSPVDVMVDGNEPVEFKWKHIIDTGSTQSKFDLEYSADNGLTWELLKSEETADTFTTIPPNTLPAGNLLWRVRTYNSDSQPGEYSASASFVVRAAPTAPAISSVTPEARPVVRWQAVGQQAYEVVVLDDTGKEVYTTGETAGTDKEQKVTDYLNAGTYTVRVRVWNIYNIASCWSDASVTVPELDRAAPVLTGWASSGVARLTWGASGSDSYALYYLLRDGKPIVKLGAGQAEYLDYTALGQHEYVLRGVTAQDQFKDSAAVRLTVRVPYAMLAPADNPGNWVELIYRRDSEPVRGENLTMAGQAVFAAGRTLPFFETNGQYTKDWSFNYSFRTLEEYKELLELVQQGKTVLYRGKDGSRCWAALTGIQTTADYLSRDYTLTAVEVDRVETIDYD